MNKQRRKKIYKVANEIQYAIASADTDAIQKIVDDAIDDIEILYDEEMDYMDNIPENLQMSMRYEMAEEACDNLNSAMNSLRYINYGNRKNFEAQIQEAVDFLIDATA